MSWKDNLDEGAKKEVEQLEVKLAEIEQKLSNAGQELAQNRKDRQAIEADRDALKIKLAEAEQNANPAPSGDAPQDVEATVRKVLQEKDSQDAQSNRETAESRFKAAHKEFADDADAGGVKFSAVKAKVSRFNLSNLRSVEDFVAAYEDAYTLVSPGHAVDIGENYTPFADSPSDSGHGPRETDVNELSPKEQKLINRMSWDKEQYLKQKNKRPAYVKQLLDYME